MEKTWRLYPDRQVIGQDFSDEKTVTIPDQSMSLKEILRRFVRRESLPVEHKGVYAEGFGDLEKMVNEDFVEQEERINELKKKVEDGKAKSRKEADAKAKAEAEAKARAAARETDPPKADSGADDGGSADQADRPKSA